MEEHGEKLGASQSSMARAEGNAQEKGRGICIPESGIQKKGGLGRKVHGASLVEPCLWNQTTCFESQLYNL